MKETLRIIGLYLWLPVQMFLLMFAKPPKDETPENQPPVQKGFGQPRLPPKEP